MTTPEHVRHLAAPRAGRDRGPNSALGAVIEAAGISHAALAHRVNQLAQAAGHPRQYTHTSVTNWLRRGMIPTAPGPQLVARALSERLGRPVTLAQIGMGSAAAPDADVGLSFPRDLSSSVQAATELWSQVERRRFLESAAFAITAYAVPTQRWLITPADSAAAHAGGRRVGTGDVALLRESAEQTRHWDSRHGGGDWRTSILNRCLHEQATPLLHGSYPDAIGRQLFAVTAELSRLAGFTAFDRGHHDAAQRYFIQALRLARAAGDLPLGGYVLASMSMQAMLRGFPNEAIDMAQAATERSRGTATSRTTAFFRLIEARAHARAGDAPAAARALSASGRLLEASRPGDSDPRWIDFYTPARFAADATEVYRDLRRPDLAWRWHTDAEPMPVDTYTRSVGMRLAIVGATRLQARDLDEGLALGHRSLDILATVQSHRAKDYIRDLLAELTPWRHEPTARVFTHRAAQMLAA